MNHYNLISFAGIFLLMVIAWCFSSNRRVVNLRLVGAGLALQIVFALILFRSAAGQQALIHVNGLVDALLNSASAGTQFLFGCLAVPPGSEKSMGFILAIQVFPMIIFFSALMSVLYFLRIMPWIIGLFAKVFAKLMRVSGAEALCTAANIFVGIESTLTIRPYLLKMTRSELCVVLVSGMATVASSVLALYIFTLRDVFPNIAGHLVSASILAAPAALVMSKLILPETETPETLGKRVDIGDDRDGSLFEAIINGAQAGLKTVFGISALLIAVLGLMGVLDMALAKCGMMVGATHTWSLAGGLGLIFRPLVLLMGVSWEDSAAIGRIVGLRSVATEVVGYQQLAELIKQGTLATPVRSTIITTYALCGFAHIASLAIFVGGTSALIPSRAGDLSKIAWRALLAATLACLMTGAIAGLFATEDAAVYLLGK